MMKGTLKENSQSVESLNEGADNYYFDRPDLINTTKSGIGKIIIENKSPRLNKDSSNNCLIDSSGQFKIPPQQPGLALPNF